MCVTNNLQRHIRNLTGDGEVVARFLVDTVEGKHSDAKYHHKLEAAKLLSRYCSPDDTLRHSCGSRNPAGQGEGHGEGHSQFWGLIPTPEELATAKHKEDEQSPLSPQSTRHSCGGRNPDPLSPRERVRVRGQENTPSPSTGEGWDGGEQDKNPPNPVHPVTYIDILNYDIAHLIRQETAEGHTIAEFLSHVMTRRDQPFTPKKLRIKHTDRMAAAREILRRGHGHWGRKPRLKVYADDVEDTNDYETLHTDLAKRMREYNEHGTDAIRFLLEVMNDTSLDPEEGYTWHHKMSAAHELTRRGWDTNYDNITPEMLQAYWRDQQSTRLSVGQKKQLAGLPTFLDDYDHYDNEDYEAIAQSIRDQEDREEAAAFKTPSAPGKSPLSPQFTRHSCESRNPATSRNPLSPRERARVRGNTPASSPSENNAATPTRHSRENGNPAASENPLSPHSTRHSCESRNPEGPESPLSLGERVRVRGAHNTPSPSTAQRSDEAEQHNTSSPSCTSMSVLPDDLDCYYEPLTPEDQAIFNYNSLIESGEFEEGEVTFVPPSDAAHRDYAIALKQIKEAAETEGVPLLPNPLAGTLHHPNIRSP